MELSLIHGDKHPHGSPARAASSGPFALSDSTCKNTGSIWLHSRQFAYFAGLSAMSGFAAFISDVSAVFYIGVKAKSAIAKFFPHVLEQVRPHLDREARRRVAQSRGAPLGVLGP